MLFRQDHRFGRRKFTALPILIIIASLSCSQLWLAMPFSLALPPAAEHPTVVGTNCSPPSSSEQSMVDRLDAGEVMVNFAEIGKTKYVIGQIEIDQSPDKVWSVLANPFEFERKICHRLKKVEILTDTPRLTVISFDVDLIFPLPDMTYVVQSQYTPGQRVDFKRVSGAFKEFTGYWTIVPMHDGSKSLVTYCIHVNPGLPIPDWITRQAVKFELPSTLTGLKERIAQIQKNDPGFAPEARTIEAAYIPPSVFKPVKLTESLVREQH